MLWTETFGTASDTDPAITTARTRLGEGLRMENSFNSPPILVSLNDSKIVINLSKLRETGLLEFFG